jgi:hypothetical protein
MRKRGSADPPRMVRVLGRLRAGAGRFQRHGPHYYTNFNRGEQNGFTEAGRPTASDLRSWLIMALIEAVGEPPQLIV